MIVEIGSARGGVLYALAQLAHESALIVSIDLPGGENCGGQSERERRLFASMGSPSQTVRCLPCNSHYATTQRLLRRLLAGRNIDLLFLDGDHSYGGVRSDFEMYRDLVARDGLIGFHDIATHPEQWGDGNEVGVFWDELKAKHEYHEFIDPLGTRHPDALYRTDRLPAWGIGVLEGAGSAPAS